MKIKIIQLLKRYRRRYYICRFRLKNVHPTFLATPKMHNVSKDIKCGAYSFIGNNCTIYPKVIIGDYTMIANNVSIIGADHNYRTPGIPMVFNGRENIPETIVGKDVWIGAHSIIMVGVKIGNGAIVAAGSVVTKDVEPYAIVGGVPAKIIRYRFSPPEILEHERMLAESKMNFNESFLAGNLFEK
ncbi:MAG: CatB-related O-acetyltransferase [Muribaculaceae bacterium]|nr:CatB-related O-acetyltransferase [Muribaculaceae bacterium]